MPTFVQRGPLFAGASLHFDLDNADEIKRELVAIQDYLEDTTNLALAAKEALQIDMARRFDTETDPEGKKWEELVRPAFDQIGILQLTGEMRDDALSEGTWQATPVGVFFDAGELPPYWHYHDIGSRRIPRGPRSFIGASDVEADRIERLGDEWLAGGIMVGGRFMREARSPAGTFMSFR